MQIGSYKIGRYHSIIKKTYTDGSIDYETSFSCRSDLAESVTALRRCIGDKVGTDNPKTLAKVEVISGKENIIKELEESI